MRSEKPGEARCDREDNMEVSVGHGSAPGTWTAALLRRGLNIRRHPAPLNASPQGSGGQTY